MNKLTLAAVAFLTVATASAAEEAPMSVHDFTMKDINGKPKPLSDYKGKVLLIVNVASRCGYTPQYEGLEKVYEKYAPQGLVVLGFPSNDFMGQEPGTEAEIKTFCETKYKVTFPLFSKIKVKGKDKEPLYKHLTEGRGEVSWNFNKFLVDRSGKVLTHFESKDAPESATVTDAIETALAQK
jgi:glutathione peroxidase